MRYSGAPCPLPIKYYLQEIVLAADCPSADMFVTNRKETKVDSITAGNVINHREQLTTRRRVSKKHWNQNSKSRQSSVKSQEQQEKVEPQRTSKICSLLCQHCGQNTGSAHKTLLLFTGITHSHLATTWPHRRIVLRLTKSRGGGKGRSDRGVGEPVDESSLKIKQISPGNLDANNKDAFIYALHFFFNILCHFLS